jgi:putative Mg2+ transporter-C (MgtC) family protein
MADGVAPAEENSRETLELARFSFRSGDGQDSKLTYYGFELQHIVKLLTAYVLTVPIGWDREKEGHSAGIRTFPIVALASCGYLLAVSNPADPAATSRVVQGLTAGIGFVGGGAIVRDGTTVHGTATAASIWMTGAIGAAVALDHWHTAVVMSLVSLFTLRALAPLKDRLDRQ